MRTPKTLQAFGMGLERAVLEYQIDINPTEAGKHWQLAHELDAAALNYSPVELWLYSLGKSVGIGVFVNYDREYRRHRTQPQKQEISR